MRWYRSTFSNIVSIRVIWSKFLVCGGIHNIGPMGKLNLGCMITINMNINIILSSSLKIIENTQNKCREISAEHKKRNSKYLPQSLEMGSINPNEFVRRNIFDSTSHLHRTSLPQFLFSCYNIWHATELFLLQKCSGRAPFLSLPP